MTDGSLGSGLEEAPNARLRQAPAARRPITSGVCGCSWPSMGWFKATDLAPRLAAHGVRLSDSQVWRLVTDRMNLRVLMVLCEILGCDPGELVFVRRTSIAAPGRQGGCERPVDRKGP